VDCDHLEPLIEAVADGTAELDAPAAAHLEACGVCRARVEQARDIERFLVSREVPAPPASFTAGVMALVRHDHWRSERFVDLGFNLALAAGVLVMLAGAGGLAWSLGFLSITIDLDALLEAARTELGGRVLSQVQTVAMAAVLLTMALALWWWTEADSSF
jgi:predicted anti-sigma-YlaC factor YlaD